MKTSGILALATLGLLGPSVWVVLEGASDEPYRSFHSGDAIVQIGVASALMAWWLVLAGFVSVQVIRKRLHPAWLVIVALGALALSYLARSPTGYISDLVKFGAAVRLDEKADRPNTVRQP